MYDVIVVGARCAGSPLAMLLARKGYRVLLVDRATFPSDTMSGHFLHPTAIARLQAWGLLDDVLATGCPRIPHWTFDFGAVVVTGTPPAVSGNGVRGTYSPRRVLLDKILVDAVAAAGAEVREGFLVEEVLTEGDSVTGIRGHDPGGRHVTESGTVVVGADGMRSLIARSVGAPHYNTTPPLTCGYYSYWSGVAMEGIRVWPREQRMMLAFPTTDDLTLVYVAWPVAEFHEVRSNVRAAFAASVGLVSELADLLQGSERAERFVGTATLPNFFRRPYGPGWALVGDAGFHKDPYLAQGMNDAFRDAELLAAAIDDGLGTGQPLEATLARYEQDRNTASMPGYDLNLRFASLRPPDPLMQQVFAALSMNRYEADRFVGALMNVVPITEFFAPQNLERIVFEAGFDPPATVLPTGG